MVAEVAATLHLHDQVQIVSILKRLHHIDNKWMLELCKNFALVNHGTNAPFGEHARLVHLFHGKLFAIFFACDEPHFAEAAFSNWLLKLEVVSRDLLELILGVDNVLLLSTAVTHSILTNMIIF